MKTAVSVSIGSDKGNEVVYTDFLDEEVCLARIGTNGDMKLARELLVYFDSLDERGLSPLSAPKNIDIEWLKLKGRIDAMGLGGVDLYFWRKKTFRVVRGLIKNLKNVPVVDGYGIKMTLEMYVIEELIRTGFLGFPKVLLTSAADREGMAIAFDEALKNGKINDLVLGDLMYVLQINRPLKSLKSVDRAVKILSPVISQLPFSVVYPTGKKQEIREPRFEKWQLWADVIAGDCHQILKYILPGSGDGRIMIVNTTTEEIVKEIRNYGFKALVTTTPRFKSSRGEGYRTFGTNVIEALLVAFGADPEDYNSYRKLIDAAGWGPNMIF